MTNHPEPTETTQQAYIVRLTKREMQCLANAVAGFYNMATRAKMSISPGQTISLNTAMQKFKTAEKQGVDIEVVQSL